MLKQEIVMLCCSDIAGQLRGKGFPARQLEARRHKGVGWTPTNLMITAHGAIAPGPWGPLGDLVLLPDLATHVRVDFGDGTAAENFVIGDIATLDGAAWSCCPRAFLKRGLAALESEAGLRLRGAFEHEFHYDAVEERPNSGYALDAFRRQDGFGELFLGALDAAGVGLDTFLPEYGPSQYEVTVAPADGLRIADHAVILREMARATAQRRGGRASFTPILRPDAVGNGVHVHFSLTEAATGRPATHDAAAPHGLSRPAGQFAAGLLARLPALVALTAASTISYQRLVPNRWSAAWTNLGIQDREASVRICPVFATAGVETARQFHLEYRAADAAASPYMLLGAIVWAGLLGIREDLPAPEPTDRDPEALAEAERRARGIVRLPRSLGEALDRLETDAALRAAMGPDLHAAYLAHKRFECDLMKDADDAEQCRRYRLAY